MELMASTAHHLFTALDVLLEVGRTRYRSPTAQQQRSDMRAALKELTSALSDWNAFVVALSSLADHFKFAPSEMTLISRVNQSLLDSMERLGGGSGRFVLLVFLAVWKAAYVTLRGCIRLLVAVARGASSASRHVTQMVSSYLRSEIARFTSLSAGTAPSVRKTFLYFLTGALLVGAPIVVLTKYVLPAFMAVLAWFWSAGHAIGAGGAAASTAPLAIASTSGGGGGGVGAGGVSGAVALLGSALMRAGIKSKL